MQLLKLYATFQPVKVSISWVLSFNSCATFLIGTLIELACALGEGLLHAYLHV